jgi:predicted Zn-dependent peptidase
MRLMTRVLAKGTSTRTSDEIAAALEDRGARVWAADSQDSVTFSLKCLRRDLPDVFAIFAEVVLDASFPLPEIETERQRLAAEIRMREDRPPSAAIRRLKELVFPQHPYARPLEGTPRTIQNLYQADLVAARAEALKPESMAFSLVGNVALDEARRLVEGAFGHLEPTAAPQATARRTFAGAGGRDEITRRVSQGFVALGVLTCPVAHEDQPALDVCSALLGGGMSSRLFDELRDRRSLGYMVGSSHQNLQESGVFMLYLGTTAGTVRQSIEAHGDPTGLFDRSRLAPAARPASGTPDAYDEHQWAAAMLWREVELLKQEPPSPEDLDRARSYLVGGYLRDHETNSQQAYNLGYWHHVGAGVEHDARHAELLRAVTSRDILRVSNKYLNDPASVLLRPEEDGAQA